MNIALTIWRGYNHVCKRTEEVAAPGVFINGRVRNCLDASSWQHRLKDVDETRNQMAWLPLNYHLKTIRK